MLRTSCLTSLGLGVALAFTVALTPCARAQTTYTESILASFTGNSGAAPGNEPFFGNIIQASDGNFYGTTYLGGADGDGVVFKITPGGTYTLLHSFAGGATDGNGPFAGVVEGTDGNFYGTTYLGGAHGDGTVFQMTPSGAVTVLHSFAGGTSDGNEEYAGLVQGTDGNFYGTTEIGGAHNDGIVYKITSGGAFTLLHSFASGATDGNQPRAGLVEGTDGNFYGATYLGGAHSDGTVYQMTPSGAVTVLHSFAGGSADGNDSGFGYLVEGTDGNFYGTTILGGAHSDGIVYKITSGGTFTLLHSFASGATDGNDPYGGVVEGSDGNFYGTTYIGGTPTDGTVFQMTPSGAVTLLYSFAGGTADGADLFAGLGQGMDGNFYGTTYIGGTSHDGTIWKLAVSPALAAQVQLTAPASVSPGESFDLSYLVSNSYNGNVPGTNNYCFATNNAGDTTGWTGTFTGEPTSQTKMLTASTTTGIYTYALTCGGIETGTATVTVSSPNITFSSVTHNFGSEPVGTAAANYGVELTNSGTAAFPFAIDFTAANGFTEYNNCGSSVAAGKTCEILFEFTPTATGAVTANWSMTPQTGFSFSPANGGTLSGTGTSAGGVTLTTNGHNFGTVSVGTQSSTYGTELVNSTAGAVTLTIGSVTAPFTSLTNCGTTLAAGQTCELEFYFKPTATGIVQQVFSLSGSTTITSGGSPLPNGGITLTGTGQ